MKIVLLTMSLLFAAAVTTPAFVSDAWAQQGATKQNANKQQQTPRKRPCRPGGRYACY